MYSLSSDPRRSGTSLLESLGATDDFHELFGDRSLTRSVVNERGGLIISFAFRVAASMAVMRAPNSLAWLSSSARVNRSVEVAGTESLQEGLLIGFVHVFGGCRLVALRGFGRRKRQHAFERGFCKWRS